MLHRLHEEGAGPRLTGQQRAIPHFHVLSTVSRLSPERGLWLYKSSVGTIRNLLWRWGAAWLLLLLSLLFPSLKPAGVFVGYADFVGSRKSKVILHSMPEKKKKVFLRTMLLVAICDTGPSGVPLGALDLLVKAWVW